MERVVPLDAETKAHEAPDHHREELRLWLRLPAKLKRFARRAVEPQEEA